MKLYIILVSCLCQSLAITVHYETTGSYSKNTKEYKTSLKDIRVVPSNTVQPREKSHNKPEIFTAPEKTDSRSSEFKPRGQKKYKAKANPRIGQSDFQEDKNHQSYMQKMADQLYIAQKHASVLSDYQKFIINQDPTVKSFVLGQTTQTRNTKPFARQKTGRAVQIVAEPVTTASTELKRIVVVTPKTSKTVRRTSVSQSDHSAQATDFKYVTLEPQGLTQYVEPAHKVTLVPYFTPQPYTVYDSGITAKPQIETVQVPTTLSLGLGAYEASPYVQTDVKHVESHPHVDPKYEFMYKVKDHEKNSHFGHMESRTDKGTYGYYFVHLPDGRLETVRYWADKTGYHAKVDYEGKAKHPPTEYKLHSHHNLASH